VHCNHGRPYLQPIESILLEQQEPHRHPKQELVKSNGFVKRPSVKYPLSQGLIRKKNYQTKSVLAHNSRDKVVDYLTLDVENDMNDSDHSPYYNNMGLHTHPSFSPYNRKDSLFSYHGHSKTPKPSRQQYENDFKKYMSSRSIKSIELSPSPDMNQSQHSGSLDSHKSFSSNTPYFNNQTQVTQQQQQQQQPQPQQHRFVYQENPSGDRKATVSAVESPNEPQASHHNPQNESQFDNISNTGEFLQSTPLYQHVNPVNQYVGDVTPQATERLSNLFVRNNHEAETPNDDHTPRLSPYQTQNMYSPEVLRKLRSLEAGNNDNTQNKCNESGNHEHKITKPIDVVPAQSRTTTLRPKPPQRPNNNNNNNNNNLFDENDEKNTVNPITGEDHITVLSHHRSHPNPSSLSMHSNTIIPTATRNFLAQKPHNQICKNVKNSNHNITHQYENKNNLENGPKNRTNQSYIQTKLPKGLLEDSNGKPFELLQTASLISFIDSEFHPQSEGMSFISLELSRSSCSENNSPRQILASNDWNGYNYAGKLPNIKAENNQKIAPNESNNIEAEIGRSKHKRNSSHELVTSISSMNNKMNQNDQNDQNDQNTDNNTTQQTDNNQTNSKLIPPKNDNNHHNNNDNHTKINPLSSPQQTSHIRQYLSQQPRRGHANYYQENSFDNSNDMLSEGGSTFDKEEIISRLIDINNLKFENFQNEQELMHHVLMNGNDNNIMYRNNDYNGYCDNETAKTLFLDVHSLGSTPSQFSTHTPVEKNEEPQRSLLSPSQTQLEQERGYGHSNRQRKNPLLNSTKPNLSLASTPVLPQPQDWFLAGQSTPHGLNRGDSTFSPPLGFHHPRLHNLHQPSAKSRQSYPSQNSTQRPQESSYDAFSSLYTPEQTFDDDFLHTFMSTGPDVGTAFHGLDGQFGKHRRQNHKNPLSYHNFPQPQLQPVVHRQSPFQQQPPFQQQSPFQKLPQQAPSQHSVSEEQLLSKSQSLLSAIKEVDGNQDDLVIDVQVPNNKSKLPPQNPNNGLPAENPHSTRVDSGPSKSQNGTEMQQAPSYRTPTRSTRSIRPENPIDQMDVRLPRVISIDSHSGDDSVQTTYHLSPQSRK